MQYFTRILKVRLPESCRNRARSFARAVLPTVDYRDSNQFWQEKIRHDHLVSKLGEEAVCKVFGHLKKAVKGPDYTIYEGKHKSWEADLFVEGTPLAVKTQTYRSAEAYGMSWTFQAAPQRRDPVLKDPHHWVCFVLLDETQHPSTAWVLPCFQIKALPFSDPVLAHLKGKKQVVYARDLPLESRRPVELLDYG